jgi:CubicO group peptidase (beta-lactamase class C family)
MSCKLTTVLLLFLFIWELANCQNQDNLYKIIGNEIDSLLSNKEIHSISVGVIKKGEVFRYHKGKLTHGKNPTNRTLYEIASLTKTFTSTLLAKAIFDKKVRIDDDIRKYLPEKFPNLEFNGQPITFRHIVTHTSGLPQMFPNEPEIFDNPNWDELPYQINKLQTGFIKSQFLEELHEVKLDTVPGHKFNYSNAGANLLGYCLERMYNRPYEDLIQLYILAPLNMTKTFVGVSEREAKLVAKGLNANGIEMPARVKKELNAEGGIISTLGDMIKYIQFQLEKDNPLVQISHQELLYGKYGDFENGLFWQIFKNGDKSTKIFQNGGAFGTSSWLTIIPERQIGIFIITNVSGPGVHQKLSIAAERIIELVE